MTGVPRLVVAAPSSGSGKTTVATGLMAAFAARGMKVSASSGPRRLCRGGTVAWHKMGEGWSWVQRRIDPQADPALAAREGWEQIARDLAAETYRLYVLDELTYPLKWGWIDVDDVVETLRTRPGRQHVVITGRYAPAALLDAADLVTEMTKVKHPMDTGQKGQRGIEW